MREISTRALYIQGARLTLTHEEKLSIVLLLLMQKPGGVTHMDTEPFGIGDSELESLILELEATSGNA